MKKLNNPHFVGYFFEGIERPEARQVSRRSRASTKHPVNVLALGWLCELKRALRFPYPAPIEYNLKSPRKGAFCLL